jgi:PhnB protein
MQLSTYLTFEDNCAEAFQFYAKVLRGEIVAMFPFGDTPACEEVPESHRNRTMHARLVVDGQAIMGSDSVPQCPYKGIEGASIAINVDSTAEAERIFNELSVGGAVQMPLAETFWAERYGMFTDHYGVHWMVNCERKQL